ncbi:NAD(P)/FAD-dependent oxidoreductase [Fructilactobacillus vespulae]|uniref:NAD(P)/FAD-dependent oxidoreductase n=1 Tax=Fructilactobacillus vespulae TaxID=1249630 RepID=UPI0039B5B574
MTNNLYDITIIGGGPIGMFAGFYAGLRNAKAQIIESLPEMGGQVKALYPEKTILDVAGFAGLTGAELIANLQEQLDTMTEVDQKVDTKVLNLKKVDAGFEITTTKGVSYSKAVILAAGNGSFKPRELRAENVDAVADKFISYSVTNLEKFAGKDVMVAGGGDSAVDMALLLEKVANQVSILHRRAEFRGLEHMIDKLNESSVQILTPYLIKRLDQVDDKLQVTAKKVKTDEETQFSVDELVVNYGFISNNKDLQSFEVQPELEHNLVKVNSELETSEPGLFSIGDQATYLGKDTLIATGLGEAPIAVNTIMKQLYPDRRLPIHSTSLHK